MEINFKIILFLVVIHKKSSMNNKSGKTHKKLEYHGFQICTVLTWQNKLYSGLAIGDTAQGSWYHSITVSIKDIFL